MNKTLLNIYYLSIFLIGLPSIYLFNPLINTLNLAKLLWIILFLVVTLHAIKNEIKLRISKTFLVLFLFFLFSQSLSIVNAQDITSFLDRYKDILFSTLFFLISIYLIKAGSHIRRIFIVLFLNAVINFLIQGVMVIDTPLFVNIASQIFHPTYNQNILANIDRGRIFLTTYDEALIPLIFYFFIVNGKKATNFFLGAGAITLIVLFSLITGFRTKIIMSIFSVLGTFILFKKEVPKILFIASSSLLSVFFLFSTIPFLNIQTGFERLLETDSNLKETWTGRTTLWDNAIQMGISYPLFGVGLGNFYDHLPPQDQRGNFLNKSMNTIHKIAIQNPHNIFLSLFAESGIIGLLSFLLLLAYFLKKDIGIMISRDNPLKCYILSFWTLFIYSLLNPWSSIYFQTLFWLFRAIIEKKVNV